MVADAIRELSERGFSLEAYKEFIYEKFRTYGEERRYYEGEEEDFPEVYYLGYKDLEDVKRIGFFALKVSKELTERSGKKGSLKRQKAF